MYPEDECPEPTFCPICTYSMVLNLCPCCGWNELPTSARNHEVASFRDNWLYKAEPEARAGGGPLGWLKAEGRLLAEFWHRYWVIADLHFHSTQYDPHKQRFYASVVYDLWVQEFDLPAEVWVDVVSSSQAEELVSLGTLPLLAKPKLFYNVDYFEAFYAKTPFGKLGGFWPATPFAPKRLHDTELLDVGRGVVLDLNNRLLWSRTLAGQRWVNGEAKGEPEELTWPEANAARPDYDLLGVGFWRLPSLDDLSSLLTNSARQPISSVAFPATMHPQDIVLWANDHYLQGEYISSAYCMSFAPGDKPAAYRNGDVHPTMACHYALYYTPAPHEFVTAAKEFLPVAEVKSFEHA